MKKFFTLFAILTALTLVVSCGGSSKNDDKTDTGDTVNDEDAADTDAADSEPAVDNEPGGDTTSDETDSDDSDTTPAPKPDDDADTASEQNDDDVDTASEQNDDDADAASEENDDDADTASEGNDDDADTASEGNDDDLPECSATSETPCKDSSTGYIWSAETEETMSWEAAKEHCDDLGDDWHLPTISELRTLIKECEFTQMGGMCDVSDNCLNTENCLSYKGCDTGCETCVNTFSEGSWLWSSSTLSNGTNAAYVVYFAHGVITGQSKETSGYMNVRCVRNTTTDPATNLEKCIRVGGKINEEGKCLKAIKCVMRPDFSKWNGEFSYVREYSNGTWLGETIETIFSTEEGTCHFVCNEGYEWNDSECVETAAPTPCDGNPCSSVTNSNGVCAVSGETYTCGCNEGFGWVDGECKQYCGAVFNGTSSYANITKANNALLHQSVWTIEAWFKQAAVSNNVVPLVAMQYHDDVEYMMTGFSKLSTNTVVLGSLKIEGSDNPIRAMGPLPSAPSNGWHHIALVNSGSKLEIFIDGNSVKSTEYTGTPATVSDALFFVGHTTQGTGLEQKKYYFNGAIDQLRFSNTARYSAAFTPAALGSDTNTVALWNFNGNTDNSSSNSLNLTGKNITYTTECR